VWLIGAVLLSAADARADDWPAWRGATGLGVSAETDLPVRWSATENVKWKVALPGPGNSTPIVWGRRVFLTQAVDDGKRRTTMCFDRRDGNELWIQTVKHDAEERTHRDNPYCSASPVTDGERVIVSHGSAGVFCYDLDGTELWRRDLGAFQHIWGNAASPMLRGELCYLNCGPGPRTFLLAVNKRTGKTVWQVDIPGGLEDGGNEKWIGSWSVPVVVQTGDRTDLVMSFPHTLLGYDPATGDERWRCGGLGRLVYTSPVVGDGVIVAASGYMGPSMAVRVGGRGDVTESHRLWRTDRAPQRIGSGVVTGGHLYLVNEPGVAECIEPKTGKTMWKERLGKECWSSPVLADGKLYIVDQAGDGHVFRAATTFERIATNPIGERTRASIAVSNGELWIRTYEHLWCIARKPV
jgi:outer membrane protein assembly factor BamB